MPNRWHSDNGNTRTRHRPSGPQATRAIVSANWRNARARLVGQPGVCTGPLAYRWVNTTR